MTLSDSPARTVYATSLEMGRNDSIALREEQVFANLPQTRTVQAFHNRTVASAQEPNPNKVARLNPAQGTVVGPALSLPVLAGDSVRLSVQASYEEGSRQRVKGALAVGAAVVEAFTGGGVAGLEGTSIARVALREAVAGSALLGDDGNKVPQAFLNYLLFDTAYQLVDQGFVRVSEAAKVSVGGKSTSAGAAASWLAASPSAAEAPAPGEELVLALDNIPQEGILYAYVSNESDWDTNVFFGEMRANQISPAPTVVDRQDYYPFGATHESLAPNPVNRFLYQGKELTNNLGLGLYDFHARQYDPLLGRFTSVDPMAASFDGMSPYAGMGNNPINMVDPDGRIPLPLAMFAGGVLGAGAGSLYGVSQGYSGRQMNQAILGGALLGMGIAAGIQTGAFAQLGQGVGNLASQGVGALQQGIGGAGSLAGQAALSVAQSSITAGPMEPGIFMPDAPGMSYGDRLFANEPNSWVPVQGPLERSSYWFEQGDMSRGVLYGVEGISDAFGMKAILSGGVKLGAKMIAKNAIRGGAQTFKAFSKSNYRHNLQVLTGNSGAGMDAHHIYPQAKRFSQQWKNAGINIHDPNNMTWWSSSAHKSAAHSYNKAWDSFFRQFPNATRQQVEGFGRSLMKNHGF